MRKFENAKGQLTRSSNALTNDISVSQVQVRQKRLKRLWQKFEDAQSAIDKYKHATILPPEGETMEQVNGKILEDSEAERTVYEDIYYLIPTQI